MRYLVVSDIHGDIFALERFIEIAKRNGGFDELWFLGDVIGHRATDATDVRACLQLLREHEALCVKGNWEVWLFRPEYDNRGHQKRWARVLKKCRESLTEEDLNYIRGWSDVEYHESGFILTHGDLEVGDAVLDYPSEFRPIMVPQEVGIGLERRVEKLFRNGIIEPEYHLLTGHLHTPGYFHYNGVTAKWRDALYIKKINISDGSRFVINPGSVSGNRYNSQDTKTALLIDTNQKTFHFLRIPEQEV